MPKSLLATSPTTECLCLAARIRPMWSDLHVAGSTLIEKVLLQWAEQRPKSSGIILVPDIESPRNVRQAAAKFVETGGSLVWIAKEGSGVAKACEGMDRVNLYQRPTMFEAFDQIYGHSQAIGGEDNQDLEDFLRYKNSIFFMKGADDISIIMDVIDLLARLKGKRFTLASVPPEDRNSLEIFRQSDFLYLAGYSEPMRQLKQRLLHVGPTPLSVLILGETGTGKEAAALYLHEFSSRRSGPFVPINCAGLDEHFLRSELFGHEEGAFTGAIKKRSGLVKSAEGGTLFLDELGDMPLSVQADLLRFLQTRRFRALGSDKHEKANVRVIAAAQTDLQEKTANGDFRLDLFFRIAEAQVTMPRLAELPDVDVQRIIKDIVYSMRTPEVSMAEKEKTIAYFNKGMPEILKYSWPGNVRELSGLIKRRLLMQEKDDVLRDIAGGKKSAIGSKNNGSEFGALRSPQDIVTLEEIQRRYVRHVWTHRQNLKLTQKELAEKLGVSVNTVKKYY